MNAKQTVPLLVTLAPLAAVAPPLIIGCLIGGTILLVLKSLLSPKEAKPEAASVAASTESRKIAETMVFRQIPAKTPGNLASVPVVSVPRVVVPPPAVLSVPRMSAPVPAPPSPSKRRTVGRQDMATVFNGGRTLDRTTAVAALKRLGFGKTAAYSALSQVGRFAPWLQCASDGAIMWTD